jgi:hypothetical protein
MASPTPWRISDAHGLCLVDANDEMVADLTPQADWTTSPPPEVLRANAELILDRVNPKPCTLCLGLSCEENCGPSGCKHVHDGPDSHKVCRRCGGTGRRA